MKKHTTKILLTAALTILLNAYATAGSVTSVAKIQVVGLFKDAAILRINDQQKMIRVGDSKHGVRLFAANSERAKIEVDGKVMILSMSDHTPIRIGLPAASDVQAHLLSSGGMYNATGSINQRVTDFVVDTGATYVTISADKAKSLGIDFSKARKLMMNTANGKATAHIIRVKSIRVSGIELNDVETAVMHNMSSPKVLLGMSFLNKVEMTQKDGVMVLKKRS